jgi:outer membrane protein assembly factor BamA
MRSYHAIYLALASCGGAGSPRPPALSHRAPLTPPPEVSWDQLVGPIRAVDVTSASHRLVPKAREVLAHEVGRDLDRDRLRGQLETLLAQPGVFDVTVRGVQLDDGIRLVVDVAPQPAIRAIAAREVGGNDVALPAHFAGALGLLDRAAMSQLVDELRDDYQHRGFYEVAIAWRAKPAEHKGEVDVSIDVAPGEASIIDAIVFHGNEHANAADLELALAGEIAAGSPWITDRIERARLLLFAYYWDVGYAKVQIDSSHPTAGRVPLVFEIREGPRFQLGKLTVTGIPADQTKSYLAQLGVKRGDLFSRRKIAAGAQALAAFARKNGITDPNVSELSKIDLEHKTIDFSFEISK